MLGHSRGALASMIVVAVIYGSVSFLREFCDTNRVVGSQVELLYPRPSIRSTIFGEISDVGRRTGMAFSIAALGALAGPPISGAINTATRSFEAMGYYAGAMISTYGILA